jgi:hypothetical protein
MAGQGKAWQGMAWHGRAGHGMAWLGWAGLGWAGQGRAVKKHTLHLNLACKKKKRKSQYRKSSEGKNHQYKSTRRLGVLLLLTCLCTQSPCCVNLYAIKKYYNGSINGLNWFEPWFNSPVLTMVRTGSNRSNPSNGSNPGSIHQFPTLTSGFEPVRTRLEPMVPSGSNGRTGLKSGSNHWKNGFEPCSNQSEPRVRTGSNLGSDGRLC